MASQISPVLASFLAGQDQARKTQEYLLDIMKMKQDKTLREQQMADAFKRFEMEDAREREHMKLQRDAEMAMFNLNKAKALEDTRQSLTKGIAEGYVPLQQTHSAESIAIPGLTGMGGGPNELPGFLSGGGTIDAPIINDNQTFDTSLGPIEIPGAAQIPGLYTQALRAKAEALQDPKTAAALARQEAQLGFMRDKLAQDSEDRILNMFAGIERARIMAEGRHSGEEAAQRRLDLNREKMYRRYGVESQEELDQILPKIAFEAVQGRTAMPTGAEYQNLINNFITNKRWVLPPNPQKLYADSEASVAGANSLLTRAQALDKGHPASPRWTGRMIDWAHSAIGFGTQLKQDYDAYNTEIMQFGKLYGFTNTKLVDSDQEKARLQKGMLYPSDTPNMRKAKLIYMMDKMMSHNESLYGGLSREQRKDHWKRIAANPMWNQWKNDSHVMYALHKTQQTGHYSPEYFKPYMVELMK